MNFRLLLLLASQAAASLAAETILGVYIFSRHGDRTPKSLTPARLTSLGYSEVYETGTYYRNRYVAANATSKMLGIESDTVKLSQLAISAPQDNVLMNSAQGFLQGLYPPVGGDASAETLRNDSKVQAPMDGYQLIPVSTVSSGTGSEDSAWLQGAGNCANALISSNAYYTSAEYQQLYDNTLDFYKNLTPAVNGTFSEDEMNYKNAYTIYDLLNVALIHNTTLTQSTDTLLPASTTRQLLHLAQLHEYGLAYNTSSPIRAISGAVLGSEILTALNATLKTPSKAPKLNIQFGAYASFLSFFGLANLPSASVNFTGINDYASSMAFEMFTTATTPPGGQSVVEGDVSVRFLFNNGTSAPSPDLTPYPLFGGQSLEISWGDFVKGMEAFAVTGQEAWCKTCGNSTGVCASSSSSAAPETTRKTGNGGISNAVAGVIGAMVTLAVVLGVEALVLLLGGLRVAKKRKGVVASGHGTGGEKAQGGHGSGSDS